MLFPPEKRTLIENDGWVEYLPHAFEPEEAQALFQHLLSSIPWESDEIWMFGKKLITERKVAWYGDEAFSYTYSKTKKIALPWTNELLAIKNRVEDLSNESFNACLLNLYPSGKQGMGWHSDNEKELKKQGTIASVSLGATRKFTFKHKQTSQKAEIYLEAGSILWMKYPTQDYWLHRLPPSTQVSAPRINLTFRNIIKGF